MTLRHRDSGASREQENTAIDTARISDKRDVALRVDNREFQCIVLRITEKNEMSIHVQLKWGTRNEHVTYAVDASYLDEALAKAVVPAKYKAGKVAACLSWSFDIVPDPLERDSSYVMSIIVKPSYKIVLPEWTQASTSPLSCQTTWKRIVDGLRRHEEGHRDIFCGQIVSIVNKLKKKGPMTTRQIADLKKEAGDEVRRAQDQYHRRAGKGVKTGVLDSVCRTPTP